jgi:DNA modification methylase
LKAVPSDTFACAVTSPPYWNLVDYGIPGQIGQGTYESYRLRLAEVWREVARTLRPNGKFCLNVPLMPLKKDVSAAEFGKTHTRMLLDLPGDLKADILAHTDLLYYSLYVWEKQTTEKMFGSYPYPPNLLERNYCEFILVFVKPGKPPKYSKAVKEAAKLTQEEWMELTKQIWWIYPENVKRKEGHPSPFPEALPNRLIRMYTFPEVPGDYEGDLVLDPFSGWGTTCVAAKRQGRHYTGIDLSQSFCKAAEERLVDIKVAPCVMTATKPKDKK